ncbi:MAG: YgiQ family radical SAM protein [Nannocystaceae bacterium]
MRGRARVGLLQGGVATPRPLFATRVDRPAAPFLPTTRAEMDALGWDACDVVIVTGDAYVDHPSFGMAIVGRLLEAQGLRVGILSQPRWQDTADFESLGRPRLFWGVTGGNMDSMVNRYTSDRKIRRDDAYSPGGEGGLRPDRCTLVYAQRCREAFRDVPIVIGGIEASLRRIAHYDYWSDKVRRSMLLDAKADLLIFGNAERALVEVATRLRDGESIDTIRDLRGTVFVRRGLPQGWAELDSTELDAPGPVEPKPDPYAAEAKRPTSELVGLRRRSKLATLRHDRATTAVRLPSFEAVRDDPVLYAHASRVLHLEANPGNARALVQAHGDRDVWLNPPPVPLTTEEMDALYELPFARVPHPRYGEARIPAYEMIRFSVTIQRGCFGGCSFCSITEHEGRVIQSRSESSILREVEQVRDKTPGFTGTISDLGGPTANMYRLACKSKAIEAACRKPSCVYPGVCSNLQTDHAPLISLYRKARALPGIKRVMIASGVRYDLAVESPEYVEELVRHHVGGYLKIAPEHVSEGPLSAMMKPGIGTYDRFKAMFERASKKAGKKQFLIPYFIAAHPGTKVEDMVELAMWLKSNGFEADQVQTFLPSPMSSATAMYRSEKDLLRGVRRVGGDLHVPKGLKMRRLHKAFLRYHDPENWPLLRSTLQRMGRGELIGNGPGALIPRTQPSDTRRRPKRGGPRRGSALTQHTGLPPRDDGSRANAGRRRKRKPRGGR